ncbi:MAG: RNA polymerase-associated protein RapA [Chlamydiae bacterium]|nr:RNA polymerase-associated protein RapA [Chlamydiota bacterium]
MIILHATLLQGKLYIWGETRFEEHMKPPKPRGRLPKNPPPKVHPFALNEEQLFALLTDMDLDASREQVTKTLAWLPTYKNLPIPSNAVLGEQPSSLEIVEHQPWALYCLELPETEAIRFLQECANKEMLKDSLRLGAEISFLFTVMNFVLSMTSRQRFLPGIQENAGEYLACWQPVFLGKDQERLSILAGHLPDLCRSFSVSMKQITIPTTSARQHLEAFITALMTSIIQQGQDSFSDVPFDSMHDQWATKLQSPDPTLVGGREDCERLKLQVQEWKRPLHLSLTAPFRFCLRLEEPKETNSLKENIDYAASPWTVKYLLQANDDPSLLVSVKDAWNPKGTKRKILHREGFNVRQYILSSLGIASGISQEIEESLKQAIPESYPLTSSEALTFLNEKAEVFEDAGFGVILPSWCTGKMKPGIKARAFPKSTSMKSSSGKSLWEMIKVDWEIALGEEVLTLEELEALSQLKEELVLVRGEWRQMSRDDIQNAIAFWKKKNAKEMSLNDIMRMSLGECNEIDGIEVEEVKASGWVAEFLQQLQGTKKLQHLTPPKKFQGVLRPYQVRGFSWLLFLRRWGLGACLADDMGLGKTPQTLASLLHDCENAEEKKPSLLVCPTSLTGNWKKEAAKFAPSLSVMVHHGIDRKKQNAFIESANEHDLVVTTYGLLHRDLDLLKEVQWKGLLLDEAQQIKNSETKQAKSASSLVSDYRVALTGTPVENNVGDLWSIFNFLNAGYLGSQAEFKRTFFRPIQLGGSHETAERLKEMTNPFILRRLKSDKSIIKDLPQKMEMKVYCSITKEQASLYETIVGDASGELEKIGKGIQRKAIILSTLMKLKQVCNHPAQFLKDNTPLLNRSGKLNRLKEMLQEILDVGESSLIFTQFSQMGNLLKEYLQEITGHEVLFLHGSLSRSKRDGLVERFQNPNGPKIFILSLKAGGTGLNLTKANHVFHFDRWWNPAVENQATDRAYRIGQKKDVQVHKFICPGTLEERIDEMIENKKAVAEKVVGTGEGWLTELNTNDLKELWTLRQEAF